MKLGIIREEWMELEILSNIYFICGCCGIFFVGLLFGFFGGAGRVFFGFLCIWELTDANMGGNKQECYGNPASTVIINETQYKCSPQNQVQMWIIQEL